MDHQAVIDRTRRWIADMVIGLNLCPFARRVFEADAIRYVVTDAADAPALYQALTDELRFLEAAPPGEVETTLLIHPHALPDFLDYLDFVAAGEQLIEDLGLSGEVQLASFHPAYQFAGTAAEAAENYTNRSPYPMLHLLREDSVTAVADDPDALLEIPRRNIETLTRLGRDAILARLRNIEGG